MNPRNPASATATLTSALETRPDARWFDRPEFKSGALTLPDATGLGPSAILLNQILARRRTDGVFELPAFPTPIVQLLELLKNPNVDTNSVVRCLRTDPVVAAEVLRFANSALYAPAEKIIDLRHSVAFLGFRRLHALALGIATKVASGNVVHPKLNHQLWIHSVGAGVLAMLIARELHIDSETAFLGGLLHDVGKIAVASEVTRLQKKLILKLSDAEMMALLELNHLEMGRSLAGHWKLPDVVFSAVVHHHGTPVPDAELRVVSVVDLADKLCYALGLGVRVTPFAILELESFRKLELDEKQASELLEAVTPNLYPEIAELS